jgi:hypothetical protein
VNQAPPPRSAALLGQESVVDEHVADEAAKVLGQLILSEPGSSEQTRLVGKLAAYVEILGAPAVIARRIERERRKTT